VQFNIYNAQPRQILKMFNMFIDLDIAYLTHIIAFSVVSRYVYTNICCYLYWLKHANTKIIIALSFNISLEPCILAKSRSVNKYVIFYYNFSAQCRWDGNSIKYIYSAFLVKKNVNIFIHTNLNVYIKSSNPRSWNFSVLKKKSKK